MNGKGQDVLWRIFMKKALLPAVSLGSDWLPVLQQHVSNSSLQ